MKKAVIAVIVALILLIRVLAQEDETPTEESYGQNEISTWEAEYPNVDFAGTLDSEVTFGTSDDGTAFFQYGDVKCDVNSNLVDYNINEEGRVDISAQDVKGNPYAYEVTSGDVSTQLFADRFEVQVDPISGQPAEVTTDGEKFSLNGPTQFATYHTLPENLGKQEADANFDVVNIYDVEGNSFAYVSSNPDTPIEISPDGSGSTEVIDGDNVYVQGPPSGTTMVVNNEFYFDAETGTSGSCGVSQGIGAAGLPATTTAAITDITGMDLWENWKAGCESILLGIVGGGGKAEVIPNEPAKQPATETKKKADEAAPDYVQGGINDRKAVQQGGSPLFDKLEKSYQ